MTTSSSQRPDASRTVASPTIPAGVAELLGLVQHAATFLEQERLGAERGAIQEACPAELGARLREAMGGAAADDPARTRPANPLAGGEAEPGQAAA